MKNSPSDIVSKSKRIRANAVWLMNAASLVVAIGALSKAVNSDKGANSFVPQFVPQADAAVMTWTGTSTSASATAVGNCDNYYTGNGGVIN